MSPVTSHKLSLTAPLQRVWTREAFLNPDAPPAAQAASLARRLAEVLLTTQFLYVRDYRAGVMLFISPGVERVLGYPAADIDFDRLYALIHPDDRALVTEATVLANLFLKTYPNEPADHYQFSVDYRMRHAGGHYIRVLRQNLAIERDEAGAAVAVLGIVTDITAHKRTNDVRFHLTSPKFPAFVQAQQHQAGMLLSEREQLILDLVLKGLTSRQIAHQLGLSPHTVNTHRRNIREKVQARDIDRLLASLDTQACQGRPAAGVAAAPVG